MNNRLNPDFWSRHFRTVFCGQISDFHTLFTGRVLATFSNIEAEAESAAEQEWQRLMSLPYGEDNDPGSLAEQAQEEGIATYRTLETVRQTMVNITAAALYHLFEQQIFFFHRRQVLNREEQDDTRLITWREFKIRLSGAGINYEDSSSWKKINELCIVANAVKHAEGHSADELRALRPDLFEG